MLSRTKTCLLRTYHYSVRCISKEISSIKASEVAKFIDSTDNVENTLHLNWTEMNDLHKQYFKDVLISNKPIKRTSESKDKKKTDNNNNQQHIDHISLTNTNKLTNKDALNMFEWLNIILSSPNNQIKHLNFDLSNNKNNNPENNVIDSECIYNLCEGINKNPNKTIELESLEFHSISMNKQDIQYIFDTIQLKCKYCEYLSLENCISNVYSDDICNVIYNFYYGNDFYGLRNTSLSEIDLYNNKFKSTYLFSNHALVSLNRNMKIFLRFAIKSYGDFLMVENILIHTNDSYFMFCLFPNLRMTIGTISREYSSYCRDVVRYNRRNWDEETIKSMRKIALISWFAILTGLLFGDIIKRGKQSWWFRIPELVGLNSIKPKKRDPYQQKAKKEKKG